MITISKPKTAYKIGFSSALSPESISAYSEGAKYNFLGEESRKLKKRFFKGYGDALRILREVKRDLVASKQNRDQA